MPCFGEAENDARQIPVRGVAGSPVGFVGNASVEALFNNLLSPRQVYAVSIEEKNSCREGHCSSKGSSMICFRLKSR